MRPAAVSDKTFGQEVLGAEMPVLVEFSAEHAPSNAALDELSRELAGKIKVVTVDVDRHSTLKDEYAVRGLPALIIFKYGKPVARRVGSLLSKLELREWIDGALILALATRRTAVGRSASSFKMANGMEVVVIPDHRAPIVTHMVWYRVGAADEPKYFSGVARLLEHVTFRSLAKIADGDFCATISRMGGETDAVGYHDATMFWQRVPKHHLKTAMEFEVDRMINLRLAADDVTAERGAILEQRRSAIASDPGGRLVEDMMAALHRGHPYGLPANGLPREVMRLETEDVLRFHQQHYAPNNAILVVSGDVIPEDVSRLAHETFGKIAPKHVPRSRLRAAPQMAPRRMAIVDPRSETARFYRAYAVPGHATGSRGEAEALLVLTRILAVGMASRLYRKLVIANKVASSVWGTYSGQMVGDGMLMLIVMAADADLSAVEGRVDEVLEDIRKDGVTQEELACAKRSLVANYIYDGADQFALSIRHGWAAVLGLTTEDVENRPAAISRVSAADVAKVATKYVVARRSVTGWLSCGREDINGPRVQASGVGRRLF